MSDLENWIYHFVKDRPTVKNALKFAYQRIFSLAGSRHAEEPEGIVYRTRAFFGFHEKSPWSSDGRWLLGHVHGGVGIEQPSARELDIVIYGGRAWTEPFTLTQTQAWNWQMGSQLQWADKSSSQVVFNDFRDGMNLAVIHNIESGREHTLPYPIGAVSPTQDRYAGFCYQTLGRCMPGYGYDFAGAKAESPLTSEQLVVFDSDGTIVSEVPAGSLPPVSEDGEAAGEQFVTHTQFSPDGERLAFLHRQHVAGRRLRSRLYCVDPTDPLGTLHAAPFHDMVSHFTWIDGNRILAFANTESSDGFFLWAVGVGTPSALRPLHLGDRDGHPHGVGDGRHVVLDRYPDRRRIMPLNWLDCETGEETQLGRFFLPMRFWEEKRVDLHPRVRADGAYVCIDVVHDGVRSMATIPLGQER